jgi:hypothetical protein
MVIEIKITFSVHNMVVIDRGYIISVTIMIYDFHKSPRIMKLNELTILTWGICI